MTDPNPVLKKSIIEGSKKPTERSQSASKRVKINEVPEFAPAKATQNAGPSDQTYYVAKKSVAHNEPNASYIDTSASLVFSNLNSKGKTIAPQATPTTLTFASSTSSIKNKTILVIIPIGIPGMGKSTFIDTQLRPFFDTTDVKFTTFSSDRIRKDLVEESMSRPTANGSRKTKDQAF